MTLNGFGVIRSKVKVTGALSDKMVSTDYLEKYSSQSLHISNGDWSKLVNDPY
jgi:hypothetical protein